MTGCIEEVRLSNSAAARLLLTTTTMRAFALILLLFVSASWAVPTSDLQAVLAEVGDLSGGVFGGIAKGIEHVAEGVFNKASERVEQWVYDGREFVKQDGLVCECLAQSRAL